MWMSAARDVFRVIAPETRGTLITKTRKRRHDFLSTPNDSIHEQPKLIVVRLLV
jgi:hypothetical protein